MGSFDLLGEMAALWHGLVLLVMVALKQIQYVLNPKQSQRDLEERQVVSKVVIGTHYVFLTLHGIHCTTYYSYQQLLTSV